MIRKPNKPSFSRSSLLILPGVVLILLAGCFSFALHHQPHAFLFLAISLFSFILISLFYHQRLNQRRAQIDLLMQDDLEKANLLEAEIIVQRKIVESLRNKILNFSQLKGLTEQLSMCLYLEETSRTLSREVNKLFGPRETTAILYLSHSGDGELALSSSQKGETQANVKSPKGDMFDHWVIKTMQPLCVEDTRSDFRFDTAEEILDENNRGMRSLIGVPLVGSDRILGLLRVDSPRPQQFNTDDLRLLTTVGDLGAVAIENAQLYARLEDLAIRDSLTGLYLRRYLLERMDSEMSRAMRRGKPLSFLMIDLDEFKKYNDKFGHMAGDIVLKTVGETLAETFKKPDDLVCRYGGEEFAVLLPDCDKAKALRTAEQLREKIAGQDINLRRQKTHITVSVGVATFPDDAKTKEEMIHRADHAMYRAKAAGRNRIVDAQKLDL